ncbi:hypothetical protein AVEN_124736-1 [Araneus ventricosus]|uniref:Uncharacterized protein n=1 Tax=Araneus ventricosus TaxID=182803 RepID=A0A4Y2ICC4_ARAVE|nr:hypothetical protein AVEN_95781-1 [Araneus ventricosus]GBM75200.1 hypothetical protein AVEN_124736-1 [Araneus ventricosus]
MTHKDAGTSLEIPALWKKKQKDAGVCVPPDVWAQKDEHGSRVAVWKMPGLITRQEISFRALLLCFIPEQSALREIRLRKDGTEKASHNRPLFSVATQLNMKGKTTRLF